MSERFHSRLWGAVCGNIGIRRRDRVWDLVTVAVCRRARYRVVDLVEDQAFEEMNR